MSRARLDVTAEAAPRWIGSGSPWGNSVSEAELRTNHTDSAPMIRIGTRGAAPDLPRVRSAAQDVKWTWSRASSRAM
jgi:hypothetical protein